MNPKKPTLSILIPVYNSDKFLRGCLQSVADQTFRDFEVIVVNDGSTDDSEAIIDEFTQKYPEFKKINQNNGGSATARNTGLNNASGDYIGFVDSDDFVDPEMYYKLLVLLQEKTADIALCEMLYFRYPGWNLDHRSSYAPTDNSEMRGIEFVKSLLEQKAPGYCMLAVYKKEMFDGVRFLDGVHVDDIYTMPEVYLKARKIVFVNDFLYYYRRRDGSSSSKSTLDTTGFHDWMLVLSHLRMTFKKNKQYDQLVSYFHQHAFDRIVQFTLALRNNHVNRVDYNDRHPALDLLSEQFVNELLGSPHLSWEQKRLLEAMNGSFSCFCIRERLHQYRRKRIKMHNLVGSFLKIWLKDRRLPLEAGKNKGKSGRTVCGKNGLSKREYDIVQRYGVAESG